MKTLNKINKVYFKFKHFYFLKKWGNEETQKDLVFSLGNGLKRLCNEELERVINEPDNNSLTLKERKYRLSNLFKERIDLIDNLLSNYDEHRKIIYDKNYKSPLKKYLGF